MCRSGFCRYYNLNAVTFHILVRFVKGFSIDMDFKMAAETIRAEYDEKRSRFIATVSPVSDENSAVRFISSIRTEFYDARHNVYAYIIKDGVMRFSDDGEPQGTGGMPVLEVLRRKMLVNTAVVVTRYFGGILLGAPGLVRAYTHAAAAALDKVKIVSMKLCEIVKVNCSYDVYARAEKFIRESGGYINDRLFAETVALTIFIPHDKSVVFRAGLIEMSSGSVKTEISGETYISEDMLG